MSLKPLLRSGSEKTLSSGFAIGVPIIFVVIVALVTEVILHYRMAEMASERSASALAFASELRARTDRELNSVLYLGSGIVGYLAVRHDRVDPAEINAVLGAVYGYGRHIRNLTVAVGHRISYVYPLEGNAQALGRDYRDLSAQWPSVALAISSRKIVITGPVKLVQGGEGLIFRAPVFVHDRYWGMLSTVIDIPSFLQAAFAGQQADRFEFAVRIDEVTGSGGGVLWGQPELLRDPRAVVLEAETPSGKWVYAVRAMEGDNQKLVWVIRGLGGLVALAMGICVFVVLRQRQALSLLAGFDPLTGLPNRRLFDDRLEQAIRRHSRKDAEGGVALIFLDLDGFKPINDKHGHKFGDTVLRIVASRITEAIRPGDTVSRWAGDEFVVLVEDAGEGAIIEMIERLRERIEQAIEIDEVAVRVLASIGAACYPDEASSAAQLLELADRRMYKNKEVRRRGNTVVVNQHQ